MSPARRRLPGDWSEPIVFCAATPWHDNRMTDQHMASHLTRYAPVLYVDPPRFRSGTARARRPEPLALIGDRLACLKPPAVPGPDRPGMRRPSDALIRRAVRRVLAEEGAEPSTIVLADLHDLFGAAPGARRVLYGMDDLVAGAGLLGISEARLERDEARRLAEADVVVAVSPVLAERWRRLGREAIVIPNGCDVDAFSAVDAQPWPADVHLAPPIAGFVGYLSNRIDIVLVDEVARRGHSVLLVGPRQHGFEMGRIGALLSLPNVQWVGPKAFTDLPAYLRAIDVGLVPYADTSFNRASFPLKVLEYLAAGRAVVSTALPGLEWLDTDLVTVADGPMAFGAAVDAALRGGLSREAVAERQAFARLHSWTVRAEALANAVGLGRTGGSGSESALPPGSRTVSSGQPRTVV